MSGDLDHVTVTEDSRLTPPEKETSLNFTKGVDHVTVFTAERGLMRRLLAHPESELQTATTYDGDEYDTVDELDAVQGAVLNVTVRLPVGCLSISRDPRKSDQHAKIVTHRVLQTDGDGAGGDR